MKTIKLTCTDFHNGTYSFVYQGQDNDTTKFELTVNELDTMLMQEWPTLPNRYQFGLFEIVVGKMVLTLCFAYSNHFATGQLNGKAVELTTSEG